MPRGRNAPRQGAGPVVQSEPGTGVVAAETEGEVRYFINTGHTGDGLLSELGPKQAIAERPASPRERATGGARGGRTSAADGRSEDSFELCVVGLLSFT